MTSLSTKRLKPRQIVGPPPLPSAGIRRFKIVFMCPLDAATRFLSPYLPIYRCDNIALTKWQRCILLFRVGRLFIRTLFHGYKSVSVDWTLSLRTQPQTVAAGASRAANIYEVTTGRSNNPRRFL